MGIMRGKLLLVFAVCAAAVMTMAPAFAGEAKVTFNNKIDRDVYVVLCWAKYVSDTEATMWKKGWYKVEPGKSRSFTLQGIKLTDDVGFYAESASRNGQKLYWRGTSDKYALLGGIHPTKSFDTDDCYIEGGMDVRFRQIDLKRNGGNFTATVNFSN